MKEHGKDKSFKFGIFQSSKSVKSTLEKKVSYWMVWKILSKLQCSFVEMMCSKGSTAKLDNVSETAWSKEVALCPDG